MMTSHFQVFYLFRQFQIDKFRAHEIADLYYDVQWLESYFDEMLNSSQDIENIWAMARFPEPFLIYAAFLLIAIAT